MLPYIFWCPLYYLTTVGKVLSIQFLIDLDLPKGKLCVPTMSAKSLGTLAMIYTTEELQNPLPLKPMLCEGDMNNPVGRSDVFLHN